MIEINLLPERIKKQKKIMALYTYLVLGVAIIVFILLSIIWNKYKKIAEIEREIKKIDAESASLQDKINEVKRFKKMEETYKKKAKIVKNLLEEQSTWIYILDKIASIVEKDMWLTALSEGRPQKQGIEINISGNALSKIVVSKFIKNLEELDEISNLTTAEIREEKIEGIDVISFNVGFIYTKSKNKK